MKITCEKCGKDDFKDVWDCIQHEKECQKENEFICYKCGKTYKWKNTDINAEIIKNQCHHIALGQAGYGSVFDGSILEFWLCDECLDSFIDTFQFKKNIYNSGSNVTYDFTEDMEEFNE